MEGPDVWTHVPARMLGFTSAHAGDYLAMLECCIRVWHAKLERNRLRRRYYDMKNSLKDLGISIPTQLSTVETVIGWPAKAVEALAVRSRFDGFTASDPDVSSFLDELVDACWLKEWYRQAVESELMHSCAFVTLSMGGRGEPDVMVALHSAETASAVWDARSGRIAYGATFLDFESGNPVEANLYTQDAIVHCMRRKDGPWSFSAAPHSMGRPLMERLAYHPTLARPFGRSRISRSVIAITDSAKRELLRAEVAAEFVTSPQKYLLGASPDIFEHGKWSAYTGSIAAFSSDGEGNLPQFGQLPQGSMQPHIDYMRSLATLFSGETNIPVSCLGIVQDNPSSAEAIYAASEPLIIEAEDLNESNGKAMRSIARMAVAAWLGEPLADLDRELLDIVPNFRNPAMPSIVSQTDAMVKLASAVPGFAGTDVFWEQVGFSEDVRRRVEAEMRASQARATIAARVLGDDSEG